MTKRERILGSLVGAAVAVAILTQVVIFLVVRPIGALRQTLSEKTVEERDLRILLKNDANAGQRWEALTGRTLSSDWNVAQRRFREHLHHLVEQHHLAEATVSPRPPRTMRNGQVELKFNIRAVGTLKEITALLTDFYRYEFLSKIDRVVLSVESTGAAGPTLSAGSAAPPRESSSSRRRGSRSSRGNGEAAGAESSARGGSPAGERRLTLQLTASTLVLPTKAPELKELKYIDLDTLTETDQGRLAHPVADYDALVTDNIFTEYVAPVVAVKPPPIEPTTRPVEPVVASKPPPANPRPDADKFVLIATTSLHGRLIACVTDTRDAKNPPARHELNEQVDDGQIVLITPRGMVVRVEAGGGDAADTTDYFYRLGKTFRDREKLEPSKYPDVAEQLQKALEG